MINKKGKSIIILTHDLINAVNMATFVKNREFGQPGLVRFDLRSDSLYVSGASSSVNIIKMIDVETDLTFNLSFCLDGDRLKRVLAICDEEEETVEFVIKKFSIGLRLGNNGSSYDWPRLGVSSIPFMKFSSGRDLSIDTAIDGESLLACINYCKHIIPNPYESGVSYQSAYFIELDNSNNMRLTAADGHRFCIYGDRDFAPVSAFPVNAWVLNTVSRFMKGTIRVQVAKNKDKIRFDCEGTTIIASNPVFKYISVMNELLKHPVDNSFTVSSHALNRMAEKALIVLDKKNRKGMFIDVGLDELKVSSSDDITGYSYQQSIPCKASSTGLYLINPVFLKDMLSVIPDDEVTFNCSEKNVFFIKGDRYLEMVCLIYY